MVDRSSGAAANIKIAAPLPQHPESARDSNGLHGCVGVLDCRSAAKVEELLARRDLKGLSFRRHLTALAFLPRAIERAPHLRMLSPKKRSRQGLNP
jgi:hypothetical protein